MGAGVKALYARILAGPRLAPAARVLMVKPHTHTHAHTHTRTPAHTHTHLHTHIRGVWRVAAGGRALAGDLGHGAGGVERGHAHVPEQGDVELQVAVPPCLRRACRRACVACRRAAGPASDSDSDRAPRSALESW
jgi:hypothetical protein